MTVLSAAVEARYSTQRLKEWTNPDAPNATSTDQTRLLGACTDASADVEIYAGVEFDETSQLHLTTVIRGVRAYLLYYIDQGAGKAALDAYHDDLEKLAKVTGRDRISPESSSHLQPTVEGLHTQARPNFDGSAFSDLQLDNPADGQDSTGGLD